MKENNSGDSLIELKGYKLADIFRDFEIPDFQRKVYSSHVSTIKQAIQEKKMLDNIITVSKSGSKWTVLDGQQRLVALSRLNVEDKMQEYDLILKVVAYGNLPEAFRNLNRGKTLTVCDLTKSYDNGKIDFFTTLGQWCSHYGSTNKLTYWAVLSSYRYSKTSTASMDKSHVTKDAFNIPAEDLDKIRKFLLEMFIIFGSNSKAKAYGMAIFRNLMKIFLEDGKLSKALVEAVRTDNVVDALSKGRSVEDYEELYRRLKSQQPTPEEVGN